MGWEVPAGYVRSPQQAVQAAAVKVQAWRMLQEGLTSPSMSSVSSLILTPMAFRKACRASAGAVMVIAALELHVSVLPCQLS